MKTGSSFLLACAALASCTTVLRSREEVSTEPYRIAITLDDGPSETMDADRRILDVLLTRRVKASFCLLTYKLKGSGPILRRILSEGHTIVFHSRNHEVFLAKNVNQLLLELSEFEEAIFRETGTRVRVNAVRPPAGLLSTTLELELRKRGVKLAYATHVPTDAYLGREDAHAYVGRLIREFRASKGGILVLHNGSELFPRPREGSFADEAHPANRAWVADELARILDVLGAEGFRFVDLDELERRP